MKKVALFLATVLTTIIVFGCRTSENAQYISTTPTPEPNAIEALNEEEKDIYYALLDSVYIFHSPADIRILEIGDFSTGGPSDFPYRQVCLNISGITIAGGKTTKYYGLVLDYENFKKLWGDSLNQMYEEKDKDAITDKWPDEHIAKINKALAQHWVDLGL